jgi:Family of unknown function (DUF5989)
VLGLSWSGVVDDHRCVALTYHTYQLDNESDEMTGFLVELFAFLGSRWKLWLRPIIIFLFIIGGLLMLSNGLFESFLPHRADDTLVPFSRSDYRHDAALLNRYSAISLCPFRFG